MPGAPLLVINPRKVVNWWNMLHLEVRENGTGAIIFQNDSVDLTVEETKAFITYARNNGDSLCVEEAAVADEPSGDAGDRFAELTGGDGQCGNSG